MSRPFTFFMLLKALPAWRALSRGAREALQDDTLTAVYERFPSTRLRYYDAAAFHGRCTDLVVWETTDLPEYYLAVESVRDSAFFRDLYFETLDIIPSVPDAWREADWNASLGVLA